MPIIFYIKTTYLLLYLAFGLLVSYMILAAAVGSKPILFLILSIYTFFWWVVGGAAFIRPNKYMKYFIATDLIAFLYFFYMLIHETYIVVWHGVMVGHVIEPGTPLYYRMEQIAPDLCLAIGLALEGIVSYLFLKKSILRK